VQEDAGPAWRCRRIARQQVRLVGPSRHGTPFPYLDDIATVPLMLRSRDTDIPGRGIAGCT